MEGENKYSHMDRLIRKITLGETMLYCFLFLVVGKATEEETVQQSIQRLHR